MKHDNLFFISGSNRVLRSIAATKTKSMRYSDKEVQTIKDYINTFHYPHIDTFHVMESFVAQIRIGIETGSFFVAPFFREGSINGYLFYHNKGTALHPDELTQLVMRNAVKQSPSGMVGNFEPMGYSMVEKFESGQLIDQLYVIAHNHIKFDFTDKTYL